MECRACGVLQLRDSGNACVRTFFLGYNQLHDYRSEREIVKNE
jgi:hypothetical protein